MTKPLKHLTRILIAAGAMALLAAACGDSTSTTNVGAAPGTGAASSTTAPAATSPSTTSTIPEPPLGAGPYPIADITIAVHPDGIDSTPSATYRLSCLGDTATVTGDTTGSAASMCMALTRTEVRSLLIQGPPTDVMCTEIYGGPEVATFTGTLDGEQVNTSIDRANGCGINDWDVTLADLLG